VALNNIFTQFNGNIFNEIIWSQAKMAINWLGTRYPFQYLCQHTKKAIAQGISTTIGANFLFCRLFQMLF
jgi:hypothetical protein